VIIEWEDGAQPIPDWTYRASFEALSIIRCASVGWIIHDGPDMKAPAPNAGDIGCENSTVNRTGKPGAFDLPQLLSEPKAR
jgi:hypothetical protein